MSMITRTLRVVFVAIWLPIALIVGWWVLSADSTSVYFPPLSDILLRLQQQWFFAEFKSDFLPSLRIMFFGFLIAVGVGVLLGVLFGLAPLFDRASAFIVSFLRSIPPVMLLPPAVI